MEIDKLIERITSEVVSKVAQEGGKISFGAPSQAGIGNIASYIDHTLLKPDSSIEQTRKICQEAKDYGFATACVLPWHVKMAAEILRGSGTKVCTVAGFPYGAASTAAKVSEICEAVANGADVIDVYMNTAAFKSGDYAAVKADIEACVQAAKGRAKIRSVAEMTFMSEEEKIKACTLIKMAGADGIKVSNFLGSGKASVEETRLIRQAVGPGMDIKVDGGIKDYGTAAAFIMAGATVLGCSASIDIVKSASAASQKKKLTSRDIAAMIDHSLLRPQLTREEVVEGCRIAKQYAVASVCVKPCDVALSKKELEGSNVLVTTVIGFPHGSHRTEAKVMEAKLAMDDGAVELDMVLNIGRLLSREFDLVEKDIKAVVDVAHARGVIVKVILENFYLTDELKEIACRICEKAGADFVKTSTGFAAGGATIPDLKLMRKTCSPRVRVKAAGGVRTLDGALAVRAAGAVRFGATATKAIMEEAMKREREGTLVEAEGGELKGGY